MILRKGEMEGGGISFHTHTHTHSSGGHNWPTSKLSQVAFMPRTTYTTPPLPLLLPDSPPPSRRSGDKGLLRPGPLSCCCCCWLLLAAAPTHPRGVNICPLSSEPVRGQKNSLDRHLDQKHLLVQISRQNNHVKVRYDDCKQIIFFFWVDGWPMGSSQLAQPPTVVCKMEAQLEYVHTAYMFFARLAPPFVCSVGAYQQNFCIGAQEELY